MRGKQLLVFTYVMLWVTFFQAFQVGTRQTCTGIIPSTPISGTYTLRKVPKLRQREPSDGLTHAYTMAPPRYLSGANVTINRTLTHSNNENVYSLEQRKRLLLT